MIDGYTDAEILELREILDKINKEIENLQNKQRKMDEYYSVRKNELLEREKYIIDLKRQLRELPELEFIQPEPQHRIEIVDELDKLMNEYLQQYN